MRSENALCDIPVFSAPFIVSITHIIIPALRYCLLYIIPDDSAMYVLYFYFTVLNRKESLFHHLLYRKYLSTDRCFTKWE